MYPNTAFAKKALLLSFLFVLATFCVMAHDVIIDAESMKGTDAMWLYLKLGYQHILPLGLDHILFVLSLFLLSPKLKPIFKQSLAFTVAHTVTLGLSVYGVIKPSPAIIEPLIAASIAYVALENIFSPRLKTSRILVVFLFGLVHGMGFAGVLKEIGLPETQYLSSLVMFNVGVELGQVTVILGAYFLLAKWFKDPALYRKYIVIPISVIIAAIAIYWTIGRIFF